MEIQDNNFDRTTYTYAHELHRMTHDRTTQNLNSDANRANIPKPIQV